MLPAIAPIMVETNVLEEPITDLIVSGGINVNTRPIRKIIAIICPSMFPIIRFDFFIAATVFFLSLTNEITAKMTAMTRNMIVNISM
jgi:hypothetical protein